MGVSKNKETPKMDGENNGKPYFLMDDLGGPIPFFWKHPYKFHHPWNFRGPISPFFLGGFSVVWSRPRTVCRRPWWLGKGDRVRKEFARFVFVFLANNYLPGPWNEQTANVPEDTQAETCPQTTDFSGVNELFVSRGGVMDETKKVLIFRCEKSGWKVKGRKHLSASCGDILLLSMSHPGWSIGLLIMVY